MAWITASRLSTVFFPTRPPRPNLPSLPSFKPRHQSPSRIQLSLGLQRKRGWVPAAKGREEEEEEEEEKEEEEFDIEDEIYEFMQTSAKPTAFPSKEELITAGRTDLVKAISTQGGWLAFGWDLGEEVEECSSSVSDSVENRSVASSSGRTMMVEAGEDSGIEGILSRLERERYLSYSVDSLGRDSEIDRGDAVSIASEKRVGNFERSRNLSSNSGEDSFQYSGEHSHKRTMAYANGTSSTPEMWRMWSLQRAGNPVSEFEAAEIIPIKEQKLDSNCKLDVSTAKEMNGVAQSTSEAGGKRRDPCDAKGGCENQIQLHLQHLESELTSASHLLRSKPNGVSHKGHDSSLDDLHSMSDAWEFKQTEIMNSRDKLRSTRAKLAVLEGKMALEIIEAQKLMEEKQRRLDGAQKALRLLHPACIIWPNSASEVLLAGSFDGWASQRRMERSDTGIFSLNLKLYAGRYEMKFIVDGVWTIDPLRPIVHNNGHVNNLLIVS